MLQLLCEKSVWGCKFLFVRCKLFPNALESGIRKISVAQLETEKFPFLIYSSYPQGLEFEMRPVERAKATFYIIKFALPPTRAHFPVTQK
jgi:hypothetical protein